METMLTFAGIAVATVVALFAALALQCLLLKATFVLMEPLAIRQSAAANASRNVRAPVEQGTRLLAQAYGKTR